MLNINENVIDNVDIDSYQWLEFSGCYCLFYSHPHPVPCLYQDYFLLSYGLYLAKSARCLKINYIRMVSFTFTSIFKPHSCMLLSLYLDIICCSCETLSFLVKQLFLVPKLQL